MEARMKIAIIGAGHVGGALGTKLSEKGHQIVFGVPKPSDSKYDALKAATKARFELPAQAAKDADTIILATPWHAAKQAIVGLGNLKGKILIDCVNPIAADLSGLEIGQTTSAGEMIAGWAEGAKVVKCFNQTGFNNMLHPDYPVKLSMFAAGDDEAAVKLVAGLARDIGFDAIELKGLQLSRQLEQLAWLWIDMAIKQGKGNDFGFAIARRS